MTTGELKKQIYEYLDAVIYEAHTPYSEITEYRADDLQDALVEQGVEIIEIGLTALVQRLRALSPGTLIIRDEAGLQLLLVGRDWIENFCKVIREFEEIGIDTLRDLLSHPNGDLAALSALSLADPSLVDEDTQVVLTDAYGRARGSGLRMALAVALSYQGNFEPLKSMVHFMNPEIAAEMEERSRQMSEALAEESPSGGYFHRMMGNIIYRELLEAAPVLIVWDIATQGVGPLRGLSGWVRDGGVKEGGQALPRSVGIEKKQSPVQPRINQVDHTGALGGEIDEFMAKIPDKGFIAVQLEQGVKEKLRLKGFSLAPALVRASFLGEGRTWFLVQKDVGGRRRASVIVRVADEFGDIQVWWKLFVGRTAGYQRFYKWVLLAMVGAVILGVVTVLNSPIVLIFLVPLAIYFIITLWEEWMKDVHVAQGDEYQLKDSVLLVEVVDRALFTTIDELEIDRAEVQVLKRSQYLRRD